jgi:hypothetical protein
MINIKYIIDGDDMTDEEYENQEEREFIVTEDMLYDLVNEHVVLGKDEWICSDSFYVTLKK